MGITSKIQKQAVKPATAIIASALLYVLTTFTDKNTTSMRTPKMKPTSCCVFQRPKQKGRSASTSMSPGMLAAYLKSSSSSGSDDARCSCTDEAARCSVEPARCRELPAREVRDTLRARTVESEEGLWCGAPQAAGNSGASPAVRISSQPWPSTATEAPAGAGAAAEAATAAAPSDAAIATKLVRVRAEASEQLRSRRGWGGA
mmetsp:Transcript_33540/g.94975  ORF Transcript_33540/g.94975 Transcript_33540/m.94975 type:complete len:203 (+) Transcript_33540:620-1228(+)